MTMAMAMANTPRRDPCENGSDVRRSMGAKVPRGQQFQEYQWQWQQLRLPPRENLEKLKKVKECEGARRVKTMATILGNNCNNANVNVWQQLKQWQRCQCVVAATLRLFNLQSNDYHHNNHYLHHNHN